MLTLTNRSHTRGLLFAGAPGADDCKQIIDVVRVVPSGDHTKQVIDADGVITIEVSGTFGLDAVGHTVQFVPGDELPDHGHCKGRDVVPTRPAA